MKKVTKIAEAKSPKVKLKKIRVAAYCRVSTDSDAQLESLEAQKTHYENYISARDDWEFAGLYFDEGITGTSKDKRPELLHLIDDCKAGKIDFIVTKSISRFSRNTTDCLELVRQLLALHIPIYFEKENLNTGSMESELFLAILSSMAEGESRSISENVKWGQRKKFSDGRFSICYGRFLGYDRGEDGTMVINREQAATVERIYSDFISGLSPKAIARRLTEDGVPTPGGQDKWYEGTVRSILKNEKYMGCALLQKTYTPDFLTKKAVRNKGEVPQYYVEDSHPAIIDPDQFRLVQDIFEERARDPKHSGATIFSGKIRCGCCGGWYGSKVWHSNDKYRRVVWQCNSKFKNRKKCTTPHLTEDEIKVAFVKALNSICDDRDFYITELNAILKRLGDTTALEKEKRILDEQRTIDAKAVNDLIAQNARVAQNQTEYQERYDALVKRYEETDAKRTEVMDKINRLAIRRRKIERFIQSLEEQPDLITEFNAGGWASLISTMTVNSKSDITFQLTSGMEVKM